MNHEQGPTRPTGSEAILADSDLVVIVESE